MRNNDIKSMHIAVYALALLGGDHQKVHTEDIAEKCCTIAPDRFKWEKYDYPDKELVRKALFHASEKKNGALVKGRSGIEQLGKSRDGWELTPQGVGWVRENESIMTASIALTPARVSKREAERFLKRMRSDPTYKIFAMTGNVDEVSSYMFTDLLNCSPDAPADIIQSKFDRIRNSAELIGDKEILVFLQLCESRFGALLLPAE